MEHGTSEIRRDGIYRSERQKVRQRDGSYKYEWVVVKVNENDELAVEDQARW